ncbi:unnamed protein product, partial [Ranitomeya imitator]
MSQIMSGFRKEKEKAAYLLAPRLPDPQSPGNSSFLILGAPRPLSPSWAENQVASEIPVQTAFADMITVDPISVLVSFVVILFLVNVFKNQKKSIHFPPGPMPLPIIGNMHVINTLKPQKSFTEMSKKYGPIFTVYLGAQRLVVLCGYDMVKDALVNHAEEFAGRPYTAIGSKVSDKHVCLVIFLPLDLWVIRDLDAGMDVQSLCSRVEHLAARVQSIQDYVEVDASEIGAGAVLSQRNSDGSLMKPCAFFSRKFSPAERNYDVGNRELLALKWAFEEWRHWLEGAKHRICGQVEPSDCPGVDSVMDRLQQIWTHVVDNLTLSQEKAQRFANRCRSNLSSINAGILFSNGENWRVMRRFTLSTLRDYGMGRKDIENKITEECDCLLQKLRSYGGKPFNNQTIINAAVANIIVSILLDHRYEYDDPTILKLMNIVNDTVTIRESKMVRVVFFGWNLPEKLFHAYYPAFGLTHNGSGQETYDSYTTVIPHWLAGCQGNHRKLNKNHIEMQNFVSETFTRKRRELDVNNQRNLIDAFLAKQQE